MKPQQMIYQIIVSLMVSYSETLTGDLLRHIRVYSIDRDNILANYLRNENNKQEAEHVQLVQNWDTRNRVYTNFN